MEEINKQNISKYLDHTDVRPDARREDIRELCEEAKRYGFHSVCVTPFRVKDAREFLGEKSDIELICVVGFPYGFVKPKEKAQEAKEAIKDGATEIDMVANIGAIKDGRWGVLKKEVKMVTDAIKPHGLKVILEVGFLTEEELFRASKICKTAGAAFVKTSTGFGPRGAKIEDIKIMRKAVGPDFGVKASGGIRDFETAKKMLEAGADRIGTSHSLEILGVSKKEKETLSKE